MQKVCVYLASPYTNGDKDQMVKLQFDAGYYLLKRGFNPYIPLYNHYMQKAHPDIDSKFPWVEYDKQWLKACDIMIRIHIKDEDEKEILSPGADIEEKYAKELGIPVFHFNTLEEMVKAIQTFSNTI